MDENQVEAEQPTETAPETTTEEVSTPEAQTVGQILDNEPAPKLVPEAAIIKEKQGRKEAEKQAKELRNQLDDLQKQVSQGATHREVSDDINSIFDKFDIDDTNKQFFKEFAGAVRAGDKSEIEALKAELSSLTLDKKRETFESVFSQHYLDALKRNPEYEGIAKPNVIKALTLDPSNKNKTFDQIIEEAYGDVIPGKRTVESTRPGGTKEPETIDYDKAADDMEYLSSILKDPVKKAEYNNTIFNRKRRH